MQESKLRNQTLKTVRTAQNNGREYGTDMAHNGTIDTRAQLGHSRI